MWNDQQESKRMLFDYKKDPNENKNVVGDRQYKNVVGKHTGILKQSSPYY